MCDGRNVCCWWECVLVVVLYGVAGCRYTPHRHPPTPPTPQEYIEKTEKFFAKHGAKTIVLARFVPIVRTFAPFVAGVGSMPYKEFGTYNVGGALLWTILFCGAGYLFGNLPVVQHNFTLVVLAIVLVSVVPVVLEIVQATKESKQGQ